MDMLFATDRVFWNFSLASHAPWPTIYPNYQISHKTLKYRNRQIVTQRYYIEDLFIALFRLRDDATKGVTELHRRAGKGELELVKSILAAGGNEQVNAKITVHGFTPLHLALANGCLDVVTVLMDHQADINACAGRYFTPLMCACHRDDFDMVQALINKGAALEKLTAGKGSLLHVVARNGNTNLLRSLLKFGMFVDVTNEDNMTPLHIATAYNHKGTVEFLIKRGAGVNNRFNACNRRLDGQNCGLTALHLAVARGYMDIVEKLIVNHAVVNAQTMDGVSPLHICCQTTFHSICDVLISRGAEVTARDHYKFTPLHYAATYGTMKAVRILMTKGANVNDMENGNSPLHLAALRGNFDIVEELIKWRAQVHLVNSLGQGMIHCAVIGRNIKCVERLMRAGADPLLPDKYSWTPLHHAGAVNLNALSIRMLIHNGASVELVTNKGWTPLHCAAYWGSYDLAYILLTRHNINLNAVGRTGCTPLHLAVRQEKEDVAKLLIAKGADVNVVDNMGWTCLHEAARRGYFLLAVLLVHSNRLATIDPVNAQGITPLHLAVKFNHLSTVQLLVKFGAEVNRTLEGGVTPLHLSARYCEVSMSIFLLRNFAFFDAYIDHGQTVLPSTVAKLNKNVTAQFLFLEISKAFESLSNDDVHIDWISIYLAQGGNPNIVSGKDGSFLSSAVTYGKDKAVELLLKLNANMELANADGLLPIHFAALHDRYDICLRLLQSGCSFDPESIRSRMTPEQMSEEKGHNRITDMLNMVATFFNYAKTGHMPGLNEISTLKNTDLKVFQAVTKATKSGTRKTLTAIALAENKIEFAAAIISMTK